MSGRPGRKPLERECTGLTTTTWPPRREIAGVYAPQARFSWSETLRQLWPPGTAEIAFDELARPALPVRSSADYQEFEQTHSTPGVSSGVPLSFDRCRCKVHRGASR